MGSRVVKIRASARAELISAHDRYEARSEQAAAGFLAEMVRVQARLSENGEMGRVWRKRRVGQDIRRIRLHRYPYAVYFLLVDDVVDVVAIAHGRRRPGYFLRRLRREG